MMLGINRKNNSRKKGQLPKGLEPEQWSIYQRMIDCPDKPESIRIAEILDLMSGLRGKGTAREKMQIKERLDRILRRYRWRLMISPSAQGPIPVFYPANRGMLNEDGKWEYEAIRLLSQLGERPRIRRCEECREWLYAAKSAKQRFCDNNGKCRQHAWDGKPEHKEQKRRNSKQSRKLHQLLDEESKRSVGFMGRVKRGGKTRP